MLRKLLLRTHGVWLVLAAVQGLAMDVAGAFFAAGPEAPMLAAAPFAALGFLEAHGLALLVGLWFWRAPPRRTWFLTSAAVGALLGGGNLLFWPIFHFADLMAVGYLTTTLHLGFAAAALHAALAREPATARAVPAP
jgi:hypothetical protein